jgi:LmbE family N-acetylglucosaminyl deacetylase
VSAPAAAAPLAVTPVGHRAAVWAPSLRHAPRLRLPRTMAGQRVLLASAHADDETLGAGGLVQAMRRRGARFTVVVATDGAGAFPDLDDAGRGELARARVGEAHAALSTLGAGGDVTFLRLPDGAAHEHEEQISFALMSLGSRCQWWVVPWAHDPHPDHQAVGRAAGASRPPGARLLAYPIWMRHRMLPTDPAVSRSALRCFGLNRGQVRRKQLAIAAHRSQIEAWAAGYEPVLPGHVLALFRQPYEPYFVDAQ